VFGIIWMGVYPAPVLRRMESAARTYVELAQPRDARAAAAIGAAPAETRP
jgi:hypothetical protein